MIVLGIESSSLVASAAIVADGVLVAEYMLNSKKTHSQTLLPMIEEITEAVGLKEHLSDISGIAISRGPGSFTGLRIGSATAKGLASVINCPVLSVPTLDAMAYQLYGAGGLVCPIMDARRMQVYTGLYSFDETSSGHFPESVRIDELTVMNTVLSQCAVSVSELVERINELGQMVTFLGDGCPVYGEQLKNELRVPVRFSPSFAARQRASAVAELGSMYLRAGVVETAAFHKPEYLRPSQAERVRDEKRAEAE